MVKPIFSGDAEILVTNRYEEGESATALAKEYGCSRKAIISAVKRQGRAVRGNQSPPPLPEDRVVNMYVRDGLSCNSIAEWLGVYRARIKDLLEDKGIQVEPRHVAREKHWAWRHGEKVRKHDGYIRVRLGKDHPMRVMAAANGVVLEHRLVMATELGRPLVKQETVHHINGDKSDNSIDNLQLRQGEHGQGVIMMCCSCGSTDIQTTTLH